ncbi:unnamed protein product, partial [Phaeothamnion confervicola]
MPASVHTNAVNCVKGEIHNVLTVLRLNARWASRSRFSQEIPLREESPLTRALKALHAYLEGVQDLRDVDTVRYLQPFLAVVGSPHTTGPMTGAALSSLHKFLLYGFMSAESPRVTEGVSLIARAITNCHFEETDPESDQVVLMKLLELSALCLRAEVGSLLGDRDCWEIFLACYRIRCLENGTGRSLLASTAGNTLAHIVLMIFERARTRRSSAAVPVRRRREAMTAAPVGTPPAAAGAAAAGMQLPQRGGAAEKPPWSIAEEMATPSEPEDSEDAPSEPWPRSDSETDGAGGGGRDNAAGTTAAGAMAEGGHPGATRNSSGGTSGGNCGGSGDTSVSVLVEVMRYLSRLSNPRNNSDDTCVLALALINIALEAGGADLGHHADLVQVMQGDLCKHLLQNSQTDDLGILSLTLRVVFNLFNSIKDHLKVQLEVFLTSVHLRILDASSHRPEQRELALESLLEFCREPALMLDLYINYDCDVHCTNLFETVCAALSRQATPAHAQAELNILNRLALEGVLSVIGAIARRCPVAPQFALPPLLHTAHHTSLASTTAVATA